MDELHAEAMRQVSAGERKPEVHSAIDEIDKELDYLSDVVDTITTRLVTGGIVGPERPSEARLHTADTPYGTDIAKRVSSQADRLRSYADRLVDLHGRLEV